MQGLTSHPQLAYGLGFKVALENVVGSGEGELEALNIFDTQLEFYKRRKSLKRGRRDSDGVDVSTIEPARKRYAELETDFQYEYEVEINGDSDSESDSAESIRVADVTPLHTSVPMDEIKDIITREISEDLLIILSESTYAASATAEEWDTVVQSCGKSVDESLYEATPSQTAC